jgi:predicted nuclease of predicted toxin-antitoxin system
MVTKDSDFADLFSTNAGAGRIVWLRFGNARRAALIGRLTAALPDIIAALQEGETLIEVQ